MENLNTVTTAVTLSNLDIARGNLVAEIGSIGEVIQGYANEMNLAFDVYGTNGELISKWYELTGKDKKGVKFERDNFKTAMLDHGYETPTVDVYWQRVKEASGYQTAGNKATAESTLDSKTLKDLKTIINRILADESEEGNEMSQKAKNDLMYVFTQYFGGDVEKDLK
jgi:hypothetical protein